MKDQNYRTRTGVGTTNLVGSLSLVISILLFTSPVGQAIYGAGPTLNERPYGDQVPGIPFLACLHEGGYPVATSQNYDINDPPDNNFWILYQNSFGEVFASWSMLADHSPTSEYAFGVYAKNRGSAATLTSSSLAGSCEYVGIVVPEPFDYSLLGGFIQTTDSGTCTWDLRWNKQPIMEYWVSTTDAVQERTISEHPFGSKSLCPEESLFRSEVIMKDTGEAPHPTRSAGAAYAEMEATLDSHAATATVGESRWVDLGVQASLQCLPGLDGPSDVTGFVSQRGWAPDGPVFWRISPGDLRLEWENVGDGEWVIDETVSFEVTANEPAPEWYANETQTTIHIHERPTSSSMADPSCSHLGYGWDGPSYNLKIEVPERTHGDEVNIESAGAPVLFLLLFALAATVLLGRSMRPRK